MATVSTSMDVKDELQCPICRECLTNPVTLDCGHNFCRGCITNYCEKWEDLGDLECPLCKARIKGKNFRPNWQLANVAEKVKCIPHLEKEDFCAKHQKQLNLFCKEDQELVCVGCERSPEHQSHTVLLLEEADKEYKDQIRIRLKVLREEREKILTYKADAEKESQDLLNQTEEERQKTKDGFQQMHQFLEEREKILLGKISLVEKEIQRRREEHLARLCRQLSSLENVIQEMEKCQETAGLFLQDIRKTLQRSEDKEAFGNPVAFPPHLTCRIRGLRDVKPLLEGVIRLFPANVTLDPDTAHPLLILSKDCRSVRRGDKRQALPDNLERFNFYPFVLGREGFSSGKHFWEVNVGSEGLWAVGVARKSVRRKGWIRVKPEKGIWAVGNYGGHYYAYHSPRDLPLTLSQEPRRIRVTLDCDEGQVAFSDAETGVHIHTYSGVSFNGETLLPFFSVFEEASLSLFP